MIKSGLCSITFRHLTPREIIQLVQQAGLDAIEWGGDVHVPPGDEQTARDVRRQTEESGLTVSSYGSYYRILDEQGCVQEFEPVLESALALGTDTIRIWAGRFGSDEASSDYRCRLVDKCRQISEQAKTVGVRLAFEFHHRTLTDSNEATVQLLQEVGHSNVYTYWQPMYWQPDLQMHLRGLELLKDCLLNLHVFHWIFNSGISPWNKAIDRRPLEEGRRNWQAYFSVPFSAERYALLEFVRNNDSQQFLDDARVLKKWLERG